MTPGRTRPSPTTSTAPAGATIAPGADDVWTDAAMIVKVKEPLESEFGYLRPDLVLFTYLHLAAYPEVADALLAARSTAIAYETVQSRQHLAVVRPDERGRRPHGHPGRRTIPRARARRPRGPARRRARRPSRARGRVRGRQRRVEQRLDRPGDGGRGTAPRQEPGSAPLGRPDPPGPHRHPRDPTGARLRGRSPMRISSSARCSFPPDAPRSSSPKTWSAR